MLVYEDCFVGTEVISDSYTQEAPFGDEKLSDIAFEVASRRVTKGAEDYGIAANVDEDAAEGATAEADDSAQQVNDIVDSFALEKYDGMKKAEFRTYYKGYIANLMKQLKPERLAAFKAGVSALITKVSEEWDSVEVYFPKGYLDYFGDNKAVPIIAHYQGTEVTPRFIFMRDGLKEIKC